MILVLARQSRTSQLLTLAWLARRTGSWEGTQSEQLTQTGQGDIPYHTMSGLVSKMGELARGQRSLLRDGLGIFHWVVSNGICVSLVLYLYYCYYYY